MDVIVNSTNCELNLDEGYVSKLILKYGGKEIQTELKKTYQHGIGIGDIAISSAGKLHCKKILHGVLFGSWVSTGNFSLKVCDTQINKRYKNFFLQVNKMFHLTTHLCLPRVPISSFHCHPWEICQSFVIDTQQPLLALSN